jgi:hypothetical protein
MFDLNTLRVDTRKAREKKKRQGPHVPVVGLEQYKIRINMAKTGNVLNYLCIQAQQPRQGF